MANYYVSSVAHLAIAQWAASTAYTVGQYVRQLATPAAGSERVFKCTVAGTSGASEPAWNLNNNATTVSGTATFTQVAGQEAEQLAGNWRAAAFSTNAINSLFTLGASDNVFVSSDHNESRAAALILAGTLAAFISVSRVGANLPPIAADYTRGATIQTTGANSLRIDSTGYWKGFDFLAGSAANNASILFAEARHYFEDCEFTLNTTNASGRFNFSNGNTARGVREFDNCGFTFGSTSQLFQSDWSEVIIKNRLANFAKGSPPTANPFSFPATNGARSSIRFEGVDMSWITGSLASFSVIGEIEIINCKLSSTVVLPTSLGGTQSRNALRIHGSDAPTIRNWYFFECGRWGQVESVKKLYADGGASDGVTPFAMEVLNGTNAAPLAEPINIPRINKKLATGSQTLTLECAYVNATRPLKSRVWAELQYLGTSGQMEATVANSRADILDVSTLCDASTQAWNSPNTRGNSTAYAVGDAFKVASNPGRIFFVTSAGTTAASEPASYATAVDGDTFSDGSTIVRVINRFKFEFVVTPQVVGFARFKIYNHEPTTGIKLLIDPKIRV
jgi:hypothetical protein